MVLLVSRANEFSIFESCCPTEIPMAARLLVQDGIKTRDTNGKGSCTRWD